MNVLSRTLARAGALFAALIFFAAGAALLALIQCERAGDYCRRQSIAKKIQSIRDSSNLP